MRELIKISNTIISKLNKKEKVRERALELTRAINREASAVIYMIHNQKNVETKLKNLKADVQKLNSLLKNYADLKYSGFSTNALQEYAEAVIFHAIVYEKRIPTPKALEIEDVPYMLGVGDAVGELRRMTLNKIIDKDLDSAKKYYRIMEQLTEILSKFNYPDSLIPIRRKQDIARGILEKTQGELAVALAADSIK